MSIFKKKNNDFLIDTENENIISETIKPHSPTALTPEEVLGDFNLESKPTHNHSALDSLKKKVANTNKNTEEDNESLLSKCMPYIVDEQGRDASKESEPIYKLQSVADILKSESNKTIEMLSEKYGLIFEDLDSAKKETKIKPELTKEPDVPVNEVTNIQSNVSILISDLGPEKKEDVTEEKEPDKKDISHTATVTFTPVGDDISSKSVKVTTQTIPIDLTNEIVKLPENISEPEESLSLEKTEFEEFIPENEIETQADANTARRKFALNKRNAFLSSFISFILTLVLAFLKLPFMNELLITNITVGMIVCSAISFITVVTNFRMFGALGKIFKKSSNPDISISFASIFTLSYAVFCISKGEFSIDILLLLNIVLFFRSLGQFFKASHLLNSLKLCFGKSQKNAVKLINDSSITFSMARNSIEGDALIAADQKTENIADFMKYSSFGSFLDGKYPFITIFSLIFSAISAVMCAIYFDGLIYGLYGAAAIQLFTALPVIFFIDSLPLYRASKKLLPKGAAIIGKTGAKYIEMANAVVLNSTDFFPKGTVTLHQLKILSENNLDDTFIRAASLTEYTGSTLAPIFKSIAKTSNIDILPDADTIKYEERLGISGWVDNRLLFIGNRTLMETHGISVPSLEVDRKILRQGFFPVYLATREKACALLIVKYSPDPKIVRELRRLTNIGITLLVNNSDPNLSEEMLCDYLGLYEDSVKIMSAAGSYMYKNVTAPLKTASTPAVFKGNTNILATLLNCATKIKRSNTILTVLYVISACLGAILFAYTSFGGSGTLLSDTFLLIYGVISTVISYIIYLTERP